MTRTLPRFPATPATVDLTPEEAAAVAVALAAQPAGPYAAAGRTALEKVIAALEPDPRRREALLASSLLVRAQAAQATERRAVVEHAVAQHRVLVLGYRDGRGRPTRREVEPQLLTRAADREYLVAWCRERQAPRWFRWDRVEAAELTGETAPRRDPGEFADRSAERRARAAGHPAGRALRRPGPAVDRAAQPETERAHADEPQTERAGTHEPRRGLVLLPGGRSGEDRPRRRPGRRPTLDG
jgi:predicted DNA-binding transcriptional regulator YafY